MKTAYIEKSTGNARDGGWAESLDLDGVGRIVVGTGPGSFAGVRAALAFAVGYSLGKPCEVLGLPSPCATAAEFFSRQGNAGVRRLAVVGDARRGMYWAALFDGMSLARGVFQTDADGLYGAVPDDCMVVTPDAARIDGFLRDMFGSRYAGGVLPTAEGLRAFAEANPSALERNPRPLYLNPAVR